MRDTILIVEEIKGLSIGEMARLLKMVHLVKEEFISLRRHAVAKESVLDFAGCLNDIGIDDMDGFDRAVSRREFWGTVYKTPLAYL